MNEVNFLFEKDNICITIELPKILVNSLRKKSSEKIWNEVKELIAKGNPDKDFRISQIEV